jgi:hypothetical protein
MPEIKDFKNNKPRSRGQTKDLKMGRRLSELHNRNNSLRIVRV